MSYEKCNFWLKKHNFCVLKKFLPSKKFHEISPILSLVVFNFVLLKFSFLDEISQFPIGLCLFTENKISKAKPFLIYGFCLIDDWSLSGVNLASRDGEERVSDWHLGWYLLVTNFEIKEGYRLSLTRCQTFEFPEFHQKFNLFNRNDLLIDVGIMTVRF